MFPEMTRLLGVRRVVQQIEAFRPLPDLGPKFDVITAHMICFNGHKSDELWKIPEWEFFLDDLAKHLTPGGRVWLELNREYDDSFYTPELKEYFEKRGAEIHEQRVLFNPLLPRLLQLRQLLAEIGFPLPMLLDDGGGALSTNGCFASFASTVRSFVFEPRDFLVESIAFRPTCPQPRSRR